MFSQTAAADFSAIYFGIAAVCFYIAARVGVVLFRSRGPHAGGNAVAHWLPIAAITLLAARDHRALAVGVIFASSVAAVFLAMGVATLSSPDHLSMHSPNRKAWGMVFPLALLALLCGFVAHFTPLHAAMFLAQGALSLMLWTARDEPLNSIDPIVEPAAEISQRKPDITLPIIAGVIALVLALMGGMLGLRAVVAMSDRIGRLGEGVIGTLILAPALVLPLLGSALNIAREPRRGGSMISTCVGVALLNLGLLLPAVILITHVQTAWTIGGATALKQATWLWTAFDPPAIPFPITVWRIETVALVLIGALLVPISIGRWTLRRTDGGLLLLAYSVYIMVNAFFVVR